MAKEGASKKGSRAMRSALWIWHVHDAVQRQERRNGMGGWWVQQSLSGSVSVGLVRHLSQLSYVLGMSITIHLSVDEQR